MLWLRLRNILRIHHPVCLYLLGVATDENGIGSGQIGSIYDAAITHFERYVDGGGIGKQGFDHIVYAAPDRGVLYGIHVGTHRVYAVQIAL